MNNNKKEFYIPSLDGIRAVAILLVFLAHAGLEKIVPGGLGVTIFFFLSGYLITTLLRKEYERKKSINLKNFYIRRLYRIWPNFYFVLTVGVVLTGLGLIPGNIKEWPVIAQVLHVTNYYYIFLGDEGVVKGTRLFWSLAVEEHFYLLFPVLYLLILKAGLSAREQFLSLLLLSVIILAWRYWLFCKVGVDEDRTYYASDTRFDCLLYGCSLAVYKNPVLDNVKYSENILKYFYTPLSVSLLIFTLIFRSEEFRETLRYSLQCIALYPLFISSIVLHNWGIFKILNYKPMRFMGVLSYSFYLVHHTVILTVIAETKNIPIIVSGFIAFTVSIIIAYIMHIYIEIPLLKRRKKLMTT